MENTFRRDGNGVPITGFGLTEKKTISFAAGTTGAVGTTTLFRVVGNVTVNVFAICSESLVSSSGTVEIGIAGNTASLANQVVATTVDAGSAYSTNRLGTAVQLFPLVIPLTSQDIILTIGTAEITDGTLEFYCVWIPLDADSSVTVA
jgi:hypothetical protein